ncbi:MAG TPA: acyltransferase [Candidatus Saccharimonadales bacterium]|nr:acyltransferase [Candidatus Saccharimonadales bacterium]
MKSPTIANRNSRDPLQEDAFPPRSVLDQRRDRIPELDGLRGMAIFMVVGFHYLEQQGSITEGRITPILQRFALMGWSGVDLFFVLSGFLIGGILIDARSSPCYFKTFYARRVFRIIPIYYLWILAYLLMTGIAGSYVRHHSNSGLTLMRGFPIYAHFVFLQNMMVIPFAGLTGAWFSHLWSLAVEEQFYLISPLVVRLLSNRSLTIFLKYLIVAVPVMRIVLLGLHVNLWLVSALMPCRADSLAIGMLAAVYWHKEESRRWLSEQSGILSGILIALFFGVLAFWKWSPQAETWGMESIGFTWLAAFYVVILLIALARKESLIARLARMAWLRELGKVSYCVYIIHLVVNVICHSLLRGASPGTTDWRGTAVTFLSAIVTFGIAWISWKIFEGPLVHFGRSFKYQPDAGIAGELGSR